MGKLFHCFLGFQIELLDLIFEVLFFLFKDNSALYFIFDVLVEYLVHDGIVSNFVGLDLFFWKLPSLNDVTNLSSRWRIRPVLESNWFSRYLLPFACSVH